MVNYEKIETEEKRTNPQTEASIFSILSFWWLNEIFSKGNKRPLQNKDLFPLLDEDKCQEATEKLQRLWDEEVAKHPPKNIADTYTGFPRKLFQWVPCGGGYRLLFALLQLHSWRQYVFVFLLALLYGLGNVLQPACLSLLLPELLKPSRDHWLAYVYAAGICLSSLLRVLASKHFTYKSLEIPQRWKSAVVGMIYKKVGL